MSRKPTVAFFGETNHPSHNVKWINHMVSNDLVDAVVFVRPNQETSHLRSEVKVFKVMKPFPFFFPLRLFKHVRNLRMIIKRENVDVLHFLWGIDDCCLGLLLNRPFLITTVGSDVLRDLRKHYLKVNWKLSKRAVADLVKRWFHLIAYRKSIAITSTSGAQQKMVLEFQPRVSKVEIVRTGVDLKHFIDLEKPQGKGQWTLFSARTMREIYNQDIIIQAFAELIKNVPDAELRMIDNLPKSDWSKYLKSEVARLNIEEKVRFLPNLNLDQMISEYLQADVCVMIPRSDGTPVSGIECMLCETPLLIGDYNYDEDLFNDKTVWQCEENSVAELVKKLVEINSLSSLELGEKVNFAKKNTIGKVDIQLEVKKLRKHYYSAQRSINSAI